MAYYSEPMLLDVFRLTSDTEKGTIKNLIEYLKRSAGGFNYMRAAAYQRAAYSGFENLDVLHKHCLGDGKTTALVQNAIVFNLIKDRSKGRKIQTFDFPKKTLALSKEIFVPMGPSFFFLEDEIVKLFYLHCRSEYRASKLNLAFLASEYQTEILDQDFYGQSADVEIVDVGPRDEDGNANVNWYDLKSLELPSASEVKERTDIFVKAFLEVDKNRLAGEKQKTKKEKPAAEGQLTLELS